MKRHHYTPYQGELDCNRDDYDTTGPAGETETLGAGHVSATVLCSDCRFRDKQGYCRSDKMWEEGIAPDNRSDCVVYDYYEGGNFWVGPNFGCVHGVRT
jgi:hypothetical protein